MGQGVGKDHLRQTGAAFKGTVSAGYQTVRKPDAMQTAVRKGHSGDLRQSGGQSRGPERHTFIEGGFSQSGNALRDADVRQGPAKEEGLLSDGCQSGGQLRRGQLIAAGEGTAANGGNALLHHQGGDFFPLAVPGGILQVRYGTGAGNGKGSEGQFPLDISLQGAAGKGIGLCLGKRLLRFTDFLRQRFFGDRSLRGLCLCGWVSLLGSCLHRHCGNKQRQGQEQR